MVGSYSLDGKANGGEENPHSLYSYSELFEERFPYYLSIGMTYGQYWHGDCVLVKYYREAEKLRQKRKNDEMYLMGAYVYAAMGRIAPAYRDFNKRGTKPKEYLSEPLDIFKKSAKEEEAVHEKQQEATANRMNSFMANFNSKFSKEKKGSKQNG